MLKFPQITRSHCIVIGFIFSIFPTIDGIKNINSAFNKTWKSLYELSILREQSINKIVMKDRKTILLRIRNNSICCNFNTSNSHSYINYTRLEGVDKWRILFWWVKSNVFQMITFTLKNLVERHFIYVSISSKISSNESGGIHYVKCCRKIANKLYLVKAPTFRR